MKRRIDGHTYNTDTATRIAAHDNGRDQARQWLEHFGEDGAVERLFSAPVAPGSGAATRRR